MYCLQVGSIELPSDWILQLFVDPGSRAGDFECGELVAVTKTRDVPKNVGPRIKIGIRSVAHSARRLQRETARSQSRRRHAVEGFASILHPNKGPQFGDSQWLRGAPFRVSHAPLR